MVAAERQKHEPKSQVPSRRTAARPVTARCADLARSRGRWCGGAEREEDGAGQRAALTSELLALLDVGSA